MWGQNESDVLCVLEGTTCWTMRGAYFLIGRVRRTESRSVSRSFYDERNALYSRTANQGGPQQHGPLAEVAARLETAQRRITPDTIRLLHRD